MSITVGSLFAGIGGFDLAATRVFGPESVRWQVEIDPWARRVLTKHWPDVPKYGDIRELTGDELEPVGLVCGGFPCQPWSLAGEQRGVEDARHLWPEMARLVQKLQPRWVVGENVPGLLKSGLDSVLADLESLGYEVWTLGIPAAAFDAPHLRERLWVMAYAKCSERRASQPGGYDTNREDAGRAKAASRIRAPGPNGGARLLADARGCSLQPRAGLPRTAQRQIVSDCRRWPVEPGVGRVVDGLSGRVDRLRGLGNAIVPQVAEQLFRWIAETDTP